MSGITRIMYRLNIKTSKAKNLCKLAKEKGYIVKESKKGICISSINSSTADGRTASNLNIERFNFFGNPIKKLLLEQTQGNLFLRKVYQIMGRNDSLSETTTTLHIPSVDTKFRMNVKKNHSKDFYIVEDGHRQGNEYTLKRSLWSRRDKVSMCTTETVSKNGIKIN